jgi:hypothetical protein
MTSDREIPYGSMAVVPGIVTLAVTLLRLTGERLGWSRTLFNPEPGGGFALVGIVWLAPFFGFWFAMQLLRMGHRPSGIGRLLGLTLTALVFCLGTVMAVGSLKLGFLTQLCLFGGAALFSIAIAWRGWPALARTLLVYGLVARVPVMLVMLAAMLGDWKTHYDVAPPDLPAMGLLSKYLWIGVLPQMTVWLFVTVLLGMVGGAVACARMGRRVAATA